MALLSEIAKEAGNIALKFFRASNEVWMKEGNSPVSEADLAVNEYLLEKLRSARPDYGWMSEENEDDLSRLSLRRTFIVDPIDGTKGFIAGVDEWCISVAIVEENEPVVAILHAPALGETYSATSDTLSTLNGSQISVSTGEPVKSVTASRKLNELFKQAYGDTIKIADYIPSLALRIAMVANGRIDAAFARSGANDWDVAAADLILLQAGGNLSDTKGEKLSYNRENVRVPALIAAGRQRQKQVMALLEKGGFLR
ncbi:MAG: 3'(2'),5'-bisphosphate nucleotidase CysQ [Rhizobiaceae bacterium]|nr:3'(2'),5'-bisphosphate nucleotidase CysQ [Rhizobiaceae bacterium]